MAPGARTVPAEVKTPDTTTRPCSYAGSRGRTVVPRRRSSSTPAWSVSRRAGERAPPNGPISTVAAQLPRSTSGRSTRCPNEEGPSRVSDGWATHSCTPWKAPSEPAGFSSAWAIPRPAVIRLSCPGRMSCSVPKLSPVEGRALVRQGEGLQPDVRVGRDCHSVARIERSRAYVVDKAPGPDGPAASGGEDPADRHFPDLGCPSGEDLEDGPSVLWASVLRPPSPRSSVLRPPAPRTHLRASAGSTKREGQPRGGQPREGQPWGSTRCSTWRTWIAIAAGVLRVRPSDSSSSTTTITVKQVKKTGSTNAPNRSVR